VEDGEIGDTLSWSAVRFFVLHLSCCFEVRGWRTSCHNVTSRNFLPGLRDFNDMFFHCETSHIVHSPPHPMCTVRRGDSHNMLLSRAHNINSETLLMIEGDQS
jgi:hypothetical protein